MCACASAPVNESNVQEQKVRAREKRGAYFLYALICTIKNVNRFKLRPTHLSLSLLFCMIIMEAIFFYIAISFSTRSLYIKFSRFTSFAFTFTFIFVCYGSATTAISLLLVPPTIASFPYLNRTMRASRNGLQ